MSSLNHRNFTDNSDDISLDALYNHFKNLNDADDENIGLDDFDFENVPENVQDILNCPITEDEIQKVVSSLKNNKASGSDNILNEYIKNTIDDLMPIYVRLFNIILDTGIIPESWSVGVMITIFENKGSRSDPEMYRGITLNSCFSKTFSSVLNNRLNKYAEEIDLISRF